MAGNSGLSNATKAKKDEFYTQLTDIEKEMRYYRAHFKGKTVFCNCDDPFESNFFKYFVLNFNKLELKKLIATCYATSPIANQQLTLFDVIGGEEENRDKPYKAVVTKVYDKTGDGGVDMFDVAELFKSGENELTELAGDGDFRSKECLELLDEADIVVTNPPFSLFRDYVATLMEHKKKFIIIGNVNAITYKEIFPLIKNNEIWIGASIHSGDRAFYVPDNYPLNASGCGIDADGRKFIRVKGVRWWTNLDYRQRHEELILVKKYKPEDYQKYDNYDAIDISFTKDIPCDYAGYMGVPITFMDKFSPDQFTIEGMAAGNSRATGFNFNVRYEPHPEDRGGCGVVNGKRVYARILIRNKHPEAPREV
ncbi:adenine-specific methyltransferase EcoRI family protein [Scardovia wiggsiae]|uniref:adenine-specific methyltransferase EcoRI family protein n=1 Tax=Scardovia wiggsiae TaxID=230143 RepID=UPI00374E4AB5